jgi:hypothetical protein
MISVSTAAFYISRQKYPNAKDQMQSAKTISAVATARFANSSTTHAATTIPIAYHFVWRGSLVIS